MANPPGNIESDQWFRQSVVGGGQAPKYELEFGKAERLGVFEYYQFFSPALLYLYGKFYDGPLLDYIDTVNPSLQLGHHRFKRQIFRGLDTQNGNADWNFVLWGIHKDEWDVFLNFLLSVTFSDPDRRIVYRIGCQDINIVDPLYMDKAGALSSSPPLLPVKMLGVDSSSFAVAMESFDEPVANMPRIKFHPPQKPTLAFALSLYRGVGNPINVWDDVRRLEQKEHGHEGHTDPGSGSHR